MARPGHRTHEARQSLYWRGYEDGMTDARDLYQQHPSKENQ